MQGLSKHRDGWGDILGQPWESSWLLEFSWEGTRQCPRLRQKCCSPWFTLQNLLAVNIGWWKLGLIQNQTVLPQFLSSFPPFLLLCLDTGVCQWSVLELGCGESHQSSDHICPCLSFTFHAQHVSTHNSRSLTPCVSSSAMSGMNPLTLHSIFGHFDVHCSQKRYLALQGLAFLVEVKRICRPLRKSSL